MIDDQTRVCTIRDLMKYAIGHLQQKGFEDARLNVELLLAHALNLQRIQLYQCFEKQLTQEELKRFRVLYERRLKHEPVQYIIGKASFMGLHFVVDPHVLIPRPETETLIEQVISLCQHYSCDEQIHILEIGTGSGNIAIAIAKFIRQARVMTIDVNIDALAVAQRNARMHSVESKVEFFLTDVFELSDDIFQKQYDFLVSNPPYVPKNEWEQLQPEIRDFEPSSAVTDGKDGLQFYHCIGEIIPKILKPGGRIVLEVGFGQAEIVVRELQERGLRQLEIIRDLQGIQRVVSGIWMGQHENFISLN